MICKSQTFTRTMAAVSIAAFLCGCASSKKHEAEDPNTLVQFDPVVVEYDQSLSHANNLVLALNAPYDKSLHPIPDVPLSPQDFQEVTTGMSNTTNMAGIAFTSIVNHYNLSSLPTSGSIEFAGWLAKKDSKHTYSYYHHLASIQPGQTKLEIANNFVKRLAQAYVELLNKHFGKDVDITTKEIISPKQLPGYRAFVTYSLDGQTNRIPVGSRVRWFSAPEYLSGGGEKLNLFLGLPEVQPHSLLSKKTEEHRVVFLDFYRDLTQLIPDLYVYLSPGRYYLDKERTKIGKIPVLITSGQLHYFVTKSD